MNKFEAIFARNHKKHLEKACELSSKYPLKFMSFRSSKPWISAEKLLRNQSSMTVFFSEVGGMGLITYQATLHNVILHPEKRKAETQKWSRFAITTKEDLLSDAKTIYVISHCKAVQPFPMTNLIKVSDGKPLSKNFKYSYALVLEEPTDIELMPDELLFSNQYSEGAVKQILVNYFERNPTARQECLDYYGLTCRVCGFNFEEAFGLIGKGFIHVHHLKPLSKIKKGYIVNPIKDLIPICPNCHSMIHKNNPPYKVEKLKAIIQSHKNNNS